MSNDYEELKKLHERGVSVIILDHHEAEYVSPDAIVLNNQLSDYPNKFLCGGGIVYQFCRFLDNLLDEKGHADKFIDLVALANTADMMSLLSLETKHLINKGFQPENIHNPFIYHLWQKNQFKLGNHITSWGAAFYIAPFVNAIVRSGTQEEKELIFASMLQHKAFEQIFSNKRGHKLGELETVVEQAMRTCTNVKNRQTKAQDAGVAALERKIDTEHLLDNKVLLFLMEPGQVDRNIAGLIANKMMAKYQRPCCILTRVMEDGIVSYQGSARGCDKTGITNFKDICAATGCTLYETGHQGAFGLGIEANKINEFIIKTNEILKDSNDEAIYFVDYIYDGANVNPQNILDIAGMDCYWGKDVDESIIAIKGLKVTKDMVALMSADKNPTLKITLPNRVAIIKFGSSQEEYSKFVTDGYVELDIIGSCNVNEWNGFVTPQIFMIDYQVVDSNKYFF